MLGYFVKFLRYLASTQQYKGSVYRAGMDTFYNRFDTNQRYSITDLSEIAKTLLEARAKKIVVTRILALHIIRVKML